MKVLNSGKSTGDIKCDMRYFPVSVEEKEEDGTIIPAAESGMEKIKINNYHKKMLFFLFKF